MIEKSKKEICEVMNKYGKMLTSQGYSIGSAKFILQTEDGVFSTKADANFENITEESDAYYFYNGKPYMYDMMPLDNSLSYYDPSFDAANVRWDARSAAAIHGDRGIRSLCQRAF